MSGSNDVGLLGRLARVPSGRRSKWVVLVLWFVAAAALGSFAGKLTGAETNDAIQMLPGGAESTQVYRLQDHFGNADESPVVFVYERGGPVTDADIAAANADAAQFKSVEHVVGDRVIGPITAKDGRALQVLVPIQAGSDAWTQVPNTVKEMQKRAVGHPDGLSFYATGPAGYATDFGNAFKGLDSTLLFSAAAVVIVILFLTYGPVLWMLPLFAVGLALAIGQAALYGAIRAGLTLNAQGGGLLTVIVFGAGTDYALLLIARYREELRRNEDKHEAMAVALHRAGPAMAASGLTVAIATLTLLLADMNSTKSFGPVCAISIAIALLAMLTLLPALLVITGRWIFWPRHPRFGSTDRAASGIWARIGRIIAVRPRAVWIGTAIVLAIAAIGMAGLKADGIAADNATTKTQDSTRGAAVLQRHFEIATGSPVVVIAKADKVDTVAKAFAGTEGITNVTPPVIKDGLAKMEGTPRDAPDSAAAEATVDRVRDSLHAITGADAKIGGPTAVVLDSKRTSARDTKVVVPIVLAIVLVILILLLRALVSPVLLTATVVLSFFAALGISTLTFKALDFHGTDTSLPLFSFVLLVALGIDYNIFLMSRVKEESERHGTHKGALVGLAATGSVITSAGLVLAGTFAALSTLPVVQFAEVGVVVAVGVLIDSLIVRSVLVTALNLDFGNRIWWPRRLRVCGERVTVRPRDIRYVR